MLADMELMSAGSIEPGACKRYLLKKGWMPGTARAVSTSPDFAEPKAGLYNCLARRCLSTAASTSCCRRAIPSNASRSFAYFTGNPLHVSTT